MLRFEVHLDNDSTRILELAPQPDDADAEVAPMFSEVWLGTELWPAAKALIHWLEASTWPQRLANTKLCVELGAGTGACGLAAAALGAPNVVLTDLPSLLSTCVANVRANSMEATVRAEALAWALELPGDAFSEGADLVLMSDCLNPVYGEAHAECLAATLHALLSRATAQGGSDTPVGLLAQARRGEGVSESVFFGACARLGLVSELMATTADDDTQLQVAVHEIRLSS